MLLWPILIVDAFPRFQLRHLRQEIGAGRAQACRGRHAAILPRKPASTERWLEIRPDLDCLNRAGMAIVRPRNCRPGPVAQLVRADRS
jgi:hypothetical protein